MSNAFAEYLLQQHELPIPGVGHLKWEAVPAAYDVADRHFNPPGGSWSFATIDESDGALPLQRLTGHLALWQNLSEEEAFEEVQAFGQHVQHQLKATGCASIAGMGSLQATDQGICFEPNAATVWLAPLAAERVIREGASHQMLVGDQQTTTTEMEAFLAEDENIAADRWWVWPAILAAVALALIVWRRVIETDF
jgi:hypothetical protein